MSEAALVGESRSRSRLPLILAMVVVALAAVAAGAWWYLNSRAVAPDWERVPSIGLLAPAGDAFREGTPWATMLLQPARPEEPNAVRLSLLSLQGTPIASDAGNPSITSLTASPVGGAGDPQEIPLQAAPEASGEQGATVEFSQPGWWRLSVGVDGAAAPADFYLLIPDPNINGPGAVPGSGTASEGEALFQRGLAGITGLNSVTYTQWLADGKGHAGLAEHIVTAGGDGAPPGFVYRAAGGMEAVVIGSTRWVHLPGDLGWTEQEGAVTVPPSEWGEEYLGATEFTILGEEEVDGARTQILAFKVPEVVEPRRQTAAWYLWWVDVESGHVRREAMVSRIHYMLNHFTTFDEPVHLEPPVMAGTPMAGAETAGTPIP